MTKYKDLKLKEEMENKECCKECLCTDREVSKCCNSEVKVINGDEGTSYY